MPFTPVQTFLGGLLLHFSTSSLLEDTGRVFGISGILDGALFGEHARWQWATIGGLVVGPVLSKAIGLDTHFPGHGLDSLAHLGLGRLALAGGLVGFGSRLGSGCTSGHMLCGVSRLSPRSIVATFTFFTTAVLTANLVPSPFPSSVKPAYTTEIPPLSTIALLISTIAGCRIAYSALRRILSSRNPSRACRALPYFLLGLTFSLGLSTSGMNDPAKVYGFLRIPEIRDFDPSLSLIMISGVLFNAIHFHSINKTKTTNFPWESWRVPTRKDINWRLVLGSIIFGCGWGLCAVCPGPSLSVLGEAIARGGTIPAVLMGKVTTFLGGMLGAMFLASYI